MGVAAFYASVATPVLEFRRLGSVTAETWAGLFEDLAGDPRWLAERTGQSEERIAPIVRAAATRRLHQARRLAARILVEIGRGSEAGARDAAASRAIFERAFARPVGAEELELLLLQRDPLLEAADSLRAMLLAAQAQAFLAARGDGPWWRSAENGAWLAAAFAEGSRLGPEERARAFGAAAVDAAALAASARTRAAAAGVRLAERTSP
jgi:hypothetical protein